MADVRSTGRASMSLGGSGDSRREIVIIEDFGCEGCSTLAASTRSDLRREIAAGTTSVTFQPLTFLDELSSSAWSTRAANAAFCAAELGSPESYEAARASLFALRFEGSRDEPHDDELAAAIDAVVGDGKQDEVRACISARPWKAALDRATTTWKSEDRLHTVPAVIVDGKELQGPIDPQTGEPTVPDRDALLEALAHRVAG